MNSAEKVSTRSFNQFLTATNPEFDLNGFMTNKITKRITHFKKDDG